MKASAGNNSGRTKTVVSSKKTKNGPHGCKSKAKVRFTDSTGRSSKGIAKELDGFSSGQSENQSETEINVNGFGCRGLQCWPKGLGTVRKTV